MEGQLISGNFTGSFKLIIMEGKDASTHCWTQWSQYLNNIYLYMEFTGRTLLHVPVPNVAKPYVDSALGSCSTSKKYIIHLTGRVEKWICWATTRVSARFQVIDFKSKVQVKPAPYSRIRSTNRWRQLPTEPTGSGSSSSSLRLAFLPLSNMKFHTVTDKNVDYAHFEKIASSNSFPSLVMRLDEFV